MNCADMMKLWIEAVEKIAKIDCELNNNIPCCRRVDLNILRAAQVEIKETVMMSLITGGCIEDEDDLPVTPLSVEVVTPKKIETV